MKFTLSWLKEHLDTDASLTEITDRLTAIGLELEGVENPADVLRPFKIARVVEAGPHPNADKLRLLKVDDGSGTPWQVVCGAPNARQGLVGVFGPPGTYVPGPAFTLKPAKIRDVESFGMMCSYRELEMGEDHDGIIELPEDAPVGTSFADYAGLDDPVIDVSVTPNKQDCMGVRGIARDLAASGIGKLLPLSFRGEGRGEGPGQHVPPSQPSPLKGGGLLPGPDVRTDDADGCPAFYGCTVTGVTNGAAPDWMQARLKAVGQKPISALVDITNYVMIDLGRPLHVYDMSTLSGGLVARKAKDGEQVLALNGKTYTLDASMTVIADDAQVHDIGGIMGGEHSGVAETTTDVLIECAYFDPEHIARTGQKLMLTSDARQRFERGVDPAFLDDGLAIATAYVTQLCGGTASEVTRAGTPPAEARTVSYDPAYCAALGGIDVPADEQKAILERLGFTIDSSSTPWTITVPTWRRDVAGKADIVEEVVRITGIDAIPSTPLPRLPGVAKPTASPAQLQERRVRRLAAARGLNEAVNWSFISDKEAAPFGGGDWTLANPISEDLKVMRPSLLPGLLSAAKRNLDRGAGSVRLFEVGRRYFKAEDGTSLERATLGIVLAGDKVSRDWRSGKAQAFTAHDVKAEVLALLEAAGAPAAKLMDFAPDSAGPGDHYHPGQAATLRLGPKNVLAAYGTLHPSTAKAFGFKPVHGAVMVAELFLDGIPLKPRGSAMREAYAPPALQAVTRDFAFLVDATMAAGDLVRAVKGADKKLITDVRVFDSFAGAGVPEGKLSLAIEVTLQPVDKSFADDDLKAIADAIVKAAAKLGAELRG
ncbi:phenylalanine--tRNA ligase subunit beta [Blastomonas sp.]|uniref:phenylalanine--tRNA ligase subunit beta n=1 Tax=Blastomonas sp. TaxID=1909299 RepID=UPI0026251F5B|nr:phenylalanine--tRNA ligase subunit beta [Blastomonas sp.]MDM7955906.1 phenylalanine--tRNA ligase subunit beta [Blastomonas sp.]